MLDFSRYDLSIVISFGDRMRVSKLALLATIAFTPQITRYFQSKHRTGKCSFKERFR